MCKCVFVCNSQSSPKCDRTDAYPIRKVCKNLQSNTELAIKQEFTVASNKTKGQALNLI